MLLTGTNLTPSAMTSQETLYTNLHEYVSDWYDGLNDVHEHDLHKLMYEYIDAITEFSECASH